MSRLVWPGVHRRIFRDRFHEVDVADRAATTVTLEHIVVEAAVGAVVNNVGFARFGVIGSIELDHLFDTYDLSAYRSAGRAGRAAGHARPGMGPHRLRHDIDHAGHSGTNAVCGSQGRAGDLHPHLGQRTGLDRHHRERSPAGSHRNRDVPATQPGGSEREARLLQSIPLQRVGTPAEIAHAIRFLLDDDAGYITGQIIRVDGGGSIAG
ncbi:short chain dehydrogenase [Mycobacterium xenopi RIVM700367]|nr:short chain dehydrogenase [Mycobacterium xenopi RIVM700367]